MKKINLVSGIVVLFVIIGIVFLYTHTDEVISLISPSKVEMTAGYIRGQSNL